MKKNQHAVHCPAPRPVPSPVKWNPEHVGVTTSERSFYERSCMDRILQQQFNPEYVAHGERPPHLYESFSYRTDFDKKQLMKFDPEYRNNKVVREEYQPGAQSNALLHDPYQPYSYFQTFPDRTC